MMRFLIDGNDLGSPLNWRDVRIKYKRDEVVRGLFTTFSSEMQFTGAAYAYLKALWDAKTCDTATLQIQQRSGVFSAWNTILDGVIMLDDAKIDRQMCLISCSAEQSGCNGIFAKNIDKEVDIGVAGDAVSGTLWAEISDTFRTWWKYTEAVTDGGPGYYAQPPVSGCYGKNALLIFNQISEYITGLGGFTNQCLPVVSNFLNSPRVDQEYTVYLSALPAVGESVVIEWDDIFGNHHKVQTKMTAGKTLNQLANELYYAMIWSDTTGYVGILNPRWKKGEVADAVHYTGPPEKLVMTFHVEIRNFAVSAGTGTITFVETQSYGYGARDCVFVPSEFDNVKNWIGLSSGGYNYGQLNAGILKMSFRKFFDICSKMWNLGMQIEPDGVGGWQIRIEPIDYFYSPPVSTTFRELVDVEHFADNNLFAKRWWFGKQDDNENTAINDGNPEATTFPGSTNTNTTNTEWWYFAKPDCEVEMDNRFEPQVVPALGFTFHEDILRGNVTNPGYMYMIDVKGYTSGPQLLAAKDYKYIVGYAITIVPPAVFGYLEYYFYNLREQPQHIYVNHRNTMPEHGVWRVNYLYDWSTGASPQLTVTPYYTTVSDGPYWLPYRWKFKRYINFNDWSAIGAAIKIGVNETDDPINDVDGWIREIEYRPYDGYTSFEIEAKK